MPFPPKRGKKAIGASRPVKKQAISNNIDYNECTTVVTTATDDATVAESVPLAAIAEESNVNIGSDDETSEDEADEDKDEDEGDNKLVNGLLNKEHALRMTIAYFYVIVYDCMPEEDWKANNLIEKLKQVAHIPKGTSIKSILKEILECKKGGTIYEGATSGSNAG